ncbi:MAG: toll/interleukin-1 receptor domain-containing protein [Verrucomicrobiales bacterium]|nr:toll/interleukin-1 receptor domain-containing protein [Verrucomicrobiales bacterium]
MDYIASEAFAAVVRAKSMALEHRLVQVVRSDMASEYPGGRIVRTTPGPLEWLEPLAYSDAMVLIGGVGGTYGMFLSALHKGMPRFPLGGTGGDAGTAYRNMGELWETMPNPGIAKSEFETFGRSIESRKDADEIAEALVPMMLRSINSRKGLRPKSVFISYSRQNAAWLNRTRDMLRPLELQGAAQIWTDLDIEAGENWDVALRRQLSICDIAVLLVSPSFLRSDYVRTVELPILLERARAGRTRLLWVVLSPCDWAQTELPMVQAALNPRVSLSEMDASDSQIALVSLRQAVERRLRESGARRS